MKKEWIKPVVMELGVENTLCDEVSPLHGYDGPNKPTPGNNVKCPQCDHWCPSERHSQEHIQRVHGSQVIMS